MSTCNAFDSCTSNQAEIAEFAGFSPTSAVLPDCHVPVCDVCQRRFAVRRYRPLRAVSASQQRLQLIAVQQRLLRLFASKNDIDGAQVTENDVYGVRVQENGIDGIQVSEEVVNDLRLPENGIDSARVPEKAMDDDRVPENGVDSARVLKNDIDGVRVPENGIDGIQVSEKVVHDVRLPENGIDSARVPEKAMDDDRLPENGIDSVRVLKNDIYVVHLPEKVMDDVRVPENGVDSAKVLERNIYGARMPENGMDVVQTVVGGPRSYTVDQNSDQVVLRGIDWCSISESGIGGALVAVDSVDRVNSTGLPAGGATSSKLPTLHPDTTGALNSDVNSDLSVKTGENTSPGKKDTLGCSNEVCGIEKVVTQPFGDLCSPAKDVSTVNSPTSDKDSLKPFSKAVKNWTNSACDQLSTADIDVTARQINGNNHHGTKTGYEMHVEDAATRALEVHQERYCIAPQISCLSATTLTGTPSGHMLPVRADDFGLLGGVLRQAHLPGRRRSWDAPVSTEVNRCRRRLSKKGQKRDEVDERIAGRRDCDVIGGRNDVNLLETGLSGNDPSARRISSGDTTGVNESTEQVRLDNGHTSGDDHIGMKLSSIAPSTANAREIASGTMAHVDTATSVCSIAMVGSSGADIGILATSDNCSIDTFKHHVGDVVNTISAKNTSGWDIGVIKEDAKYIAVNGMSANAESGMIVLDGCKSGGNRPLKLNGHLKGADKSDYSKRAAERSCVKLNKGKVSRTACEALKAGILKPKHTASECSSRKIDNTTRKSSKLIHRSRTHVQRLQSSACDVLSGGAAPKEKTLNLNKGRKRTGKPESAYRREVSTAVNGNVNGCIVRKRKGGVPVVSNEVEKHVGKKTTEKRTDLFDVIRSQTEMSSFTKRSSGYSDNKSKKIRESQSAEKPTQQIDSAIGIPSEHGSARKQAEVEVKNMMVVARESFTPGNDTTSSACVRNRSKERSAVEGRSVSPADGKQVHGTVTPMKQVDKSVVRSFDSKGKHGAPTTNTKDKESMSSSTGKSEAMNFPQGMDGSVGKGVVEADSTSCKASDLESQSERHNSGKSPSVIVIPRRCLRTRKSSVTDVTDTGKTPTAVFNAKAEISLPPNMISPSQSADVLKDVSNADNEKSVVIGEKATDDNSKSSGPTFYSELCRFPVSVVRCTISNHHTVSDQSNTSLPAVNSTRCCCVNLRRFSFEELHRLAAQFNISVCQSSFPPESSSCSSSPVPTETAECHTSTNVSVTGPLIDPQLNIEARSEPTMDKHLPTRRKRRRRVADCFSVVRKRRRRPVSRSSIGQSRTTLTTASQPVAASAESANQSEATTNTILSQSETITKTTSQSEAAANTILSQSEVAKATVSQSEVAAKTSQIKRARTCQSHEPIRKTKSQSESTGNKSSQSKTKEITSQSEPVATINSQLESTMKTESQSETTEKIYRQSQVATGEISSQSAVVLSSNASGDTEDEQETSSEDEDYEDCFSKEDGKPVITVLPPVLHASNKTRSVELSTRWGSVCVSVTPKLNCKLTNTHRPLSKTVRKKLGFSEFHHWLEPVRLRDVIKYVCVWPRPLLQATNQQTVIHLSANNRSTSHDGAANRRSVAMETQAEDGVICKQKSTRDVTNSSQLTNDSKMNCDSVPIADTPNQHNSALRGTNKTLSLSESDSE